MSSAIFKVLNLSTGEYITVKEYNRALIRDYITIHESVQIYHTDFSNSSKSWYVSPPSNTDLIKIATYLNIPFRALDTITVHAGYAYDAE
jgi:hypothetical protein